MQFATSEALTFGLELEFQIVNQTSGLLTPAGLELWQQLSQRQEQARFSLEATLATIELNSSVHHNADEMAAEVLALAGHIRQIARAAGLDIRGGGTQMAQFWNERVMAPTERARELEAKFGFLPKRFSTYGMHVHIGMPSADDAIRVGNILQALSPLFIALSAASPFLQLADTGFAAARPLETLMYPHGGPMPELRDWAHFEAVAQELFATDLAKSLKDIYWDVRPKPEFGTVEVRVFDTPLSVRKAVALAAFTRACAALALSGQLRFPAEPPPASAQRVSRFMACRDAMKANLYNAFAGAWMPAHTWFEEIDAAIQALPGKPQDAAHLRYLRAQLDTRQDHEIMRAAWAELQSRIIDPGNLEQCLPNYSKKIC